MTLMKKEIEQLLQGTESKYRLAMIAAKRARQINNGSQPLVETKAHKPTTIALEEIAANKLKVTVVENMTLVQKNLETASEEKAN